MLHEHQNVTAQNIFSPMDILQLVQYPREMLAAENSQFCAFAISHLLQSWLELQCHEISLEKEELIKLIKVLEEILAKSKENFSFFFSQELIISEICDYW